MDWTNVQAVLQTVHETIQYHTSGAASEDKEEEGTTCQWNTIVGVDWKLLCIGEWNWIGLICFRKHLKIIAL